MSDIEAFKSVLKKSRRIVGFTGAGISTESGIPDYRSQGGIWEKYTRLSESGRYLGEVQACIY